MNGCPAPGVPFRAEPPAKRKPGRPPKERPSEVRTAAAFLLCIRHFLPELPEWMDRIPDPRKRPESCTYSMKEICMLALLMLCCQCGSRRQLDRDRLREAFLLNFRVLAGDDEAGVTCADNMNRVLEMVSSRQLETLAVRCSKALNKKKLLRKFRFEDMVVVAVDGTQMMTFKSPHCSHCLTRELSNGTIQYYHYVLAAKIVTPVGLVLPAGFEFVENPSGKFDKQDCETKAFKRLAGRMRRTFKGFRVLMVGDGLYANEPVMDICKKNNWSYMAVLTDDSLPTLQKQVSRALEGRRVVDGSGKPRLKPSAGTVAEYDPDTGLKRTVAWITPLRYHGRIVHRIEKTETGPEKQTYHNVWITDLKPNRKNAMALAKAGRLRWKIENEGINTQKTGGYEMEHGYGVKGNALKSYYLLMQIAQLLNDLFRLGEMPKRMTGDVKATFAALYGSVRNFAGRLMESLRNDIINPESGPDPGSIQIRLPDPPLVYKLD